MVAIMTDTNSGITVAEGKANGFYVLPMPVLVDNRCYMEGVDITHEELYGSLMANCSVHTSQPAPGEVTDMWDRILQAVNSAVRIALHLLWPGIMRVKST